MLDDHRERERVRCYLKPQNKGERACMCLCMCVCACDYLCMSISLRTMRGERKAASDGNFCTTTYYDVSSVVNRCENVCTVDRHLDFYFLRVFVCALG